MIDNVIKDIQAEREFSKPRNNMYDKIMSSAVNTIFYPMFVKADKFLATDACISCGKCVQVCPLNNVQLKNGKPVFEVSGGDFSKLVYDRKSKNMERKAKENHDIPLKKFLIDLLKHIIYRTDIAVVWII